MFMYAYMYVYMYACLCMYMHQYLCICILHETVYVRTDVSMYICMHSAWLLIILNI